MLVAKSIVHAIRTQTSPHGGRFLLKDGETELWSDIGDQKATEKTSQALRENAPEIRTEMQQEQSNRSIPVQTVPGKVLPNGLIALEYEGIDAVAKAQRGLRGGPVTDGMIDASSAYPANGLFAQQQMLQAQMQQEKQPQQPNAMDPMAMAFRAFMGVQQQTQVQPSSVQDAPPADPVEAFKKMLTQANPTAAPTGQAGPNSAATDPKPQQTVNVVAATKPDLHALQKAALEQSLLASNGKSGATVPAQPALPSKPAQSNATLEQLLAASNKQSSAAAATLPVDLTLKELLAMAKAQNNAAASSLPQAVSLPLSATASLQHSLSRKNSGHQAAPSAVPPPDAITIALTELARGNSLTGLLGGAATAPSASIPVPPPATALPSDLGRFGIDSLTGQLAATRQPSSLAAPNVTREMALQILLQEKAQKAQRAQEEEARLKSAYLQHLTLPVAGGNGLAESSLVSLGNRAGLAGGLTGGLPGSGGLMSAYLAEQGTGAMPPLQNLDVSKMTDNEIREALRRLQGENVAATPAADPHALTGLLRGSSLLGDQSNLLSLTGSRLPGSLATGSSNPVLGISLQRQASEYANMYAGLLSGGGVHQPTALTAPAPTLMAGKSLESLALEEALLKLDAPRLDALQSLGLTSLRPGVSAMLSQLSAIPGGRPEFLAHPSFTDPLAAASYLKTGSALPTGEPVPMTSKPQRVDTGGSIDDLCRAAGVALGKGRSGQGGLQPGKTDTDLLGDSEHGSGRGSAGTQPKPASRKKSAGRKKKKKPPAALTLGKNDQSLMNDSDNDSDDDKPLASLTKRKSSKKRKGGRPTLEERVAKRVAAATSGGDREGNGKSEDQSAINGAPRLDRGASFGAGMQLTALDHGHSLAMSEVSFERGPSVSVGSGGGGKEAHAGASARDDGQFDDASEDEGA